MLFHKMFLNYNSMPGRNVHIAHYTNRDNPPQDLDKITLIAVGATIFLVSVFACQLSVASTTQRRYTFKSLINGHSRLLISEKKSILPAVFHVIIEIFCQTYPFIQAYPFIRDLRV